MGPNSKFAKKPESQFEPGPVGYECGFEKGGAEGDLAACSMKANLKMVNNYIIYYHDGILFSSWQSNFRMRRGRGSSSASLTK